MPASKKTAASKRKSGPVRKLQQTQIAAVAAAPAASTVVADTGALTPGVYMVTVVTGSDDSLAAGKVFLVQHRNAANAANAESLAALPVDKPASVTFPEVTIADGERIRVVTGATAAVAATTYGAYIFVRQAR